MIVKFLNSDSTISTTIAGSYFKGDGWTGAYYDSGTGIVTFDSDDGLGFSTDDLRGVDGTDGIDGASVTIRTATAETAATTSTQYPNDLIVVPQ